MRNDYVVLIDSDLRRRAAISHALGGMGIHAEPFESIDGVSPHRLGLSIVLVEDTGDSLVDLLDRMTDAAAWSPVIALSEDPSPQRVVRAIREGAVDYLMWPCDAAAIANAIAMTQESATYLVSHKRREARARSRIGRLTPREREVLACVALGQSNRVIGEQLAISPRTVEIHRASLLNKMGASRTAEAIRIAIEASLIN